jgi:hypothetical protein
LEQQVYNLKLDSYQDGDSSIGSDSGSGSENGKEEGELKNNSELQKLADDALGAHFADTKAANEKIDELEAEVCILEISCFLHLYAFFLTGNCFPIL